MSRNAMRKPLAPLTSAERLDVGENKIDWDQIDQIVQAELAAIDRAIIPSTSTVRIRGGSTHGRTWHLFSYRAFEPLPETGIDPVIAGLTFAAAKEGNAFLISGDISGESLGDILLEVPPQEVTGPTMLIATTRDMCRSLVAGSDKVAAALREPSRQQ
jgi:hypothetical protein